jgi:chaperonin GroES
MAFKPLSNRILVERKEAETKTSSGIIIPDNASKEKPSEAVVKAVASDVSDIKVGDVVFFSSYSGNEIIIDGKESLVLEYKDILGISA